MHCTRFLGASLLAVVALVATPRVAAAQEQATSVAAQQNRGLKVGLEPTLVLPLRSNGPWGGGLSVDGRYGIPVGRTVIAPGGRISGYLISERAIGIAMPTARVTVPVGPLAPYLVGGVGVGVVTNDSEAGAALLGGGGMMIHVGRGVAFGAEATYQTITGTEFNTVTISPTIMFVD
jgi:hypothetical protein